MPSNRILKVAVPCQLPTLLDYRLDATLSPRNVVPGMRVVVPFRRQTCIGVVFGITASSGLPDDKLKTVLELPDAVAVYPPSMLDLLRWASRYYLHPVGMVANAALPARLRRCGQSFSQPAEPDVWCAAPASEPDHLRRAPRQRQILALLSRYPDGLDRHQLDGMTSNWRAPLQALVDKRLVVKRRRTCRPSSTPPPPPRQLNREQVDAISRILQPASGPADDTRIHCLFGVTGSGKTEVYLALIRHYLQQDKQILVMVPEIGLTPQISHRLTEALPVRIAVFHSGLNESQRYAAWYDAASGRARVLVGTRSSVFTPMPDLGLIILDEEHDGSYKQQDGFRYNARDLAVVRARNENCRIVLGSATPSLETLNNINEQRYHVSYLRQRANARPAPSLQLINLCNQKIQEGLSATLIERITRHLDQDGQVLLFINRRGFSPLLMCHHCGWHMQCPRCDSNMTYHKRHHQVRCHHCDCQRPAPERCGECGSDEVIAIGSGTERIETVLKTLFPDTRISRIDRDSTRRKGSLQAKLARARSGETGILVGTQMLAKGHDFPNLTLVAILDTDQALYSSDFRAAEHLAQLVTQVAGRAGRAEKTGEVILQTHHPEHPLLQSLLHDGYRTFAEKALQERRQAGLPPCRHMVMLRSESVRPNDGKTFLQEAVQVLQQANRENVDIFGPVSAPMEKRAGRYRYQLMLQASSRSTLNRLLHHCLDAISRLKSARRARWSIDVDPYDTF